MNEKEVKKEILAKGIIHLFSDLYKEDEKFRRGTHKMTATVLGVLFLFGYILKSESDKSWSSWQKIRENADSVWLSNGNICAGYDYDKNKSFEKIYCLDRNLPVLNWNHEANIEQFTPADEEYYQLLKR
jgi:hypothetical protein